MWRSGCAIWATTQPLRPTQRTPHEGQPASFWAYATQHSETKRALIGALLVLPGILFVEIAAVESTLIDLLSFCALLIAGAPIAAGAWRTLRFSRTINIGVLMTIAAIGAVLIGEVTEAAVVMVLFAIGEALEGYTVGRARSAIQGLGEIAPTQATKLQVVDGRILETVTPVAQLAVGDTIAVRPGERLPMDGLVVEGASAVNQAPITGESRLVEKEVGDTVFAGSVNGHGALEIEVARIAEDNTISRLVRMVEEAQEHQAPAQRYIDRFAASYTPVVVVLALAVAILPPLLFGQPFLDPPDGSFGWLYRGLALLVVACPCALVISTPVSIISAIANGARSGVVFKGGAALEALSGITVLAFDKTGTLTEGKPSVVSVRSPECASALEAAWPTGFDHCAACDDLLALASAVERRSEHPMAHAILVASQESAALVVYPTAADVTAISGLGVTGTVEGRAVVVGSHAHFDAHVLHSPQQCAQAKADEAQGLTPIMVGADGAYLGAIVVSDTVRPSARERRAVAASRHPPHRHAHRRRHGRGPGNRRSGRRQ